MQVENSEIIILRHNFYKDRPAWQYDIQISEELATKLSEKLKNDDYRKQIEKTFYKCISETAELQAWCLKGFNKTKLEHITENTAASLYIPHPAFRFVLCQDFSQDGQDKMQFLVATDFSLYNSRLNNNRN